MKRILLVIDDYGELLFLQTLLKKLGFDVDGIQNERHFEENFLSLNPEIIVATAKGKKVNGIDIAEGMRKVRGFPKIILIAGGPILERLRGLKISSVDGVIESPVSANQLLGQIAEVGQLDKETLLDKYRKLKATLSADREADREILKREIEDEGTLSVDAHASAPPSAKPSSVATTLSSEERAKRYQAKLAEMEPLKPGRFPRERILQFTKDIRAHEDATDSDALEGERQAFVKAMFRKAKGS